MILKTKIFQSSTIAKDDSLEDVINDWLSERPGLEVMRMLQSESVCESGKLNVTITLLYQPTAVVKAD